MVVKVAKIERTMRFVQRELFFILLAGILACVPIYAQEKNFGSSLASIQVEKCPLVDNPWGGVESTTGDVFVSPGHQFEVTDEGKVSQDVFSPSVAVGDLNGDGLPDLVVGDARGYIWFYPNIGTKTNPAFGQGEVMPIWFGSNDLREKSRVHNDVVPRIQLIDLNGDGKLDLMVGTFDGSLYMLPNTGNSTSPEFRQPSSLDAVRIPTRSESKLWCNFLAPCLYDWKRQGVFDLVMGEGTYSANSIYLLQNKGDNNRPAFAKETTLKIIPGMGREHLTPCVVDWNADGKPDVISGAREGFINLFLNTTADSQNPTFDAGTHLKIGGQDRFGQLTTVTIADLNNNQLPNLVISNTTGHILYATNSGKRGNPQFNTAATPLKGKNLYPKIYQPTGWSFRNGFGNSPPYGNSYEVVAATSVDVEKGFTPPADHQGKFALRAYVLPLQNKYFTQRYSVDPSAETLFNEHVITYDTGIPVQSKKHYKISFNVQIDGDVSETRFHLFAWHNVNGSQVGVDIDKPFGASTGWSKVTDTFQWETTGADPNEIINMEFTYRWHGTGSIYFDDLMINKSDL